MLLAKNIGAVLALTVFVLLLSGCAGPKSVAPEIPHVIRVTDTAGAPISGVMILPAAAKTLEPYSIPASNEKGEIHLSGENFKVLGLDRPDGALLYIRKPGYEFAEIKLDKDTSWPASVILRPAGESQTPATP